MSTASTDEDAVGYLVCTLVGSPALALVHRLQWQLADGENDSGGQSLLSGIGTFRPSSGNLLSGLFGREPSGRRTQSR